MSESLRVGIYATPLEACDAVNVLYEEQKIKGGYWTLLNIQNDSNGKGDARAVMFSDGKGGCVWNWKDSTHAIWFDDYKDGKPLTNEQRRAIEAERKRAVARFEAEERAKHERAGHCALTLFRCSNPCDPKHPYLLTKHIAPVETLRTISYAKAFEIWTSYYRQSFNQTPKGIYGSGGLPLNEGSLLLVPMRGDVSHVQTIQLIDDRGHKAFLKGGKMKGAYWQSEKLPEFDSSYRGVIGIGEGVATVLSVAQVKGFPVVSAMNCGNLKAVALEIRARFPSADILILGDVGNGENDAFKASQAVKGRLAVPKFTDALTARFKAITGKEKPTDFNDFYIATGEI